MECLMLTNVQNTCRSSRPEVFLRKGVLKICSRFAGEHICRSAILIKLQSNFIETTLRKGCCPVNLLHIFKTPFLKNTSEWLLLYLETVLNHFRNKWRFEYIPSLLEYQKNFKWQNWIIPSVDDIVNMYDDKMPWHKWFFGHIFGIITQTNPPV